MSDISTIFDKVASRFDSEKMSDLNASVQFDLSGEGGKVYHVSVADGNINHGEGALENPDAVVSMDADDFKAMSSGDLNPMAAFMQGKIKVSGDMSTVMKFQSLLTG